MCSSSAASGPKMPTMLKLLANLKSGPNTADMRPTRSPH